VGRGVTCTALSAVYSIIPFTTRDCSGPAAVKIREARVWQMTYQVGMVEGDDELFIKAAFAQ
jgi:hypothetical protein